jgi:phospholipid transport system substrate-binding protein
LNKKIRAIAHRGFDWEEISQRSLGLYWRERTQDERKEFTTLFSNLLEDLYIRKVIDNYAGEKVFYDKELIEGNKALIETRVINKAGTEVSVRYRVIKKGAEWVAYDVIIEGVSMVKNYRVQFYTIIRQASYSELIKKLKDKQLAEPSSISAKETKAVE